MNRKILSIVAIGLVAGGQLFFFNSCSNGGENNNSAQKDTTAAKSSADKADAALNNAKPTASQTIDLKITGNNMQEMAYSQAEIHAKAGSTVKLALTNTCTDASMLHNFVLTTDANVQSLINKGDIQGKNMPGVTAASKLLQPGQSDTITFTVPAAGTYPFICTYPGHYPKMQGKLIAE